MSAVEAAWRVLLTTYGEASPPEGSPLREPFAELLRVAHAEPLLRQFHPWAGMWELHFSRCTESPCTWDLPYIGTLNDGRYYVEGPSRNSPRIAETDSARTAVAMVVERLAPHRGPAFVGNAEELAARESDLRGGGAGASG
ncbi:DUF6193 family natural product biosynthesis protein [Streptomyces sp. NPDC059575]|uniref:DUF6193 family natural product biosynthesis protein n=1 Tax=Streptomyces sp. NPDC059575 TaxID=3346872 RepID=UPI003695DEC7